jgi:Fanconi anemia group J protein
MIRSKGIVVIEPTGSQKAFEEARELYNQNILSSGSAILLAVYRGKMSEGISFNDNFCRAVILVGLPYPNSFDLNVTAKKKYNDEQRKFRKRTELLEGQRWYELQAYRAVAQALGRCIRYEYLMFDYSP